MKQWMRAALLIWLLVPGTLWAQAVIVPTIIPLAEDNTVPNKIAADCNISQSIFEGSQLAALEAGITLQHSDAVTRTAAGRTLNLFITDAISSGNAFIGHKKSVTVVGKLY